MLLRDSDAADRNTEQKFLDKAGKHPFVKRDMEKHKLLIADHNLVRHLGKRLVCPKCESMAYRDGRSYSGKLMGRCVYCGWHGEAVTLDEYMTYKLYR